MKTWVIVVIVVVALIAMIAIYMSASGKTKQQTPVVVESAPKGSNFFDFASAVTPSIIAALGKNKPTTGVGATSPTEPQGTGWINFNDQS